MASWPRAANSEVRAVKRPRGQRRLTLLFGPACVVVLSFVVLAAVTTEAASAVLVYEHSENLASGYPMHEIVAARNDGTAQRVIARGYSPQISPSGHRVAYFAYAYGGDRLYVVGTHGRHRHLLVRHTYDIGAPG